MIRRRIREGQPFMFLDEGLAAAGPVPSTNNLVESWNARLRDMPRRHRGLRLVRRLKAIVFCQVGVGRFGVSFSPCERRVSGRFGVGRSCWLLVIALVIA